MNRRPLALPLAAAVLCLPALPARADDPPPAAVKPASTAPDPSQMETVYLVLLKKGPKWSPEETKERQAIQDAHMANIRALWEAKKMVLAGPLEDPQGEMRGVFIFRVASLEEARALAASDPAVKAGRLAMDVYPWWVMKGTLPAAGSFCETK